MSLMNAKKARPVEDASALVPFGWAPGGYHCAACSTCGEAHAGSDKRSMRCQDCAEALRDKQPDEPTPTTRETADHAELAACPFCGGSATIERFGNTRVSTQYQCDDCGCFLETGEEFHHGRAWNRRPREEALLSEIAALRGERKGLKNRVSCLERLCGEQSTRVMEQATRAKDAERQRDEAVGLLRELAGGRSQKNNINEYDDLSVRASTLLSNQGADQ